MQIGAEQSAIATGTLLHDVLARVVRLVDALADGDLAFAAASAESLEADLLSFLVDLGFESDWGDGGGGG